MLSVMFMMSVVYAGCRLADCPGVKDDGFEKIAILKISYDTLKISLSC